MGKILKKIMHWLYVAYYRGLYYFPFGIRRINSLREIKVPEHTRITSCRLEVSDQVEQFHNFVYAKINPKPWFVVKGFFWLRMFAFKLPGCSIYFKAPRFTPWDYNAKTQEVRFGVNHTLLNRLKNDFGIEIKDIKFISWQIFFR